MSNENEKKVIVGNAKPSHIDPESTSEGYIDLKVILEFIDRVGLKPKKGADNFLIPVKFHKRKTESLNDSDMYLEINKKETQRFLHAQNTLKEVHIYSHHSKGDLVEKVLGEDLSQIDFGIPVELFQKIPLGDRIYYVMDFRESHFGILLDLRTKANIIIHD